MNTEIIFYQIILERKIDNRKISDIAFKLYRLLKEDILSSPNSASRHPARPIPEQKLNPLPDRKALDDIVFDILGLTEDKRSEVYWAVCELVKNRLEKARSV
ncbi:MAG: hypothetical protein ACUVUQ_10975 [Thermodesulfovibrionales bacterium]